MFQLGFQCLDALVALRERSGNIGGVESLRDVLGAIRVPGGDGKEDRLLGPCLVSLGHQHRRQLGVTFHDPRLATDLDAPAMRVVDHEEMSLGIVGEIALGNVLLVAGEFCEADELVVEHPQRAARAATMLDVRLALFVSGADEDARLSRDELCKVGRDTRVP